MWTTGAGPFQWSDAQCLVAIYQLWQCSLRWTGKKICGTGTALCGTGTALLTSHHKLELNSPYKKSDDFVKGISCYGLTWAELELNLTSQCTMQECQQESELCWSPGSAVQVQRQLLLPGKQSAKLFSVLSREQRQSLNLCPKSCRTEYVQCVQSSRSLLSNLGALRHCSNNSNQH